MPLHHAARLNHLDVGKVLLQSNCSLDIVGEFKLNKEIFLATPFRLALLKEHFDFAELLLCGGYDLKLEPYLYSNTDVPKQLIQRDEIWLALKCLAVTPRPLSLLSRSKVRSLLGKDIHVKVTTLNLPTSIVNCILLNTGLG